MTKTVPANEVRVHLDGLPARQRDVLQLIAVEGASRVLDLCRVTPPILGKELASPRVAFDAIVQVAGMHDVVATLKLAAGLFSRLVCAWRQLNIFQ